MKLLLIFLPLLGFTFAHKDGPLRRNVHQHLHKRSNGYASPDGYSLLFSQENKLPSFDDCINYQSTTSSDTASTECAEICNKIKSCKFFALFNTAEQLDTPYCGWWSSSYTTSDVNTWDGQLNNVYQTYGYNRDDGNGGKDENTDSGNGEAENRDPNQTSTIDGNILQPTANSSRTDPDPATQTSDPQPQETQQSDVEGFSVIYLGQSGIPSASYMIDYFHDIGSDEERPSIACSKNCLKEPTCKFFTIWEIDAQKDDKPMIDCAIYDKAFTQAEAIVTSFGEDGKVMNGVGYKKG